MKTISVFGSHGVITAREDGTILEVSTQEDPTLDEEAFHYHSIEQFDFDEWKQYWGKELDQYIDILDLGYWFVAPNFKRVYEPADEFHRQMIEDDNLYFM